MSLGGPSLCARSLQAHPRYAVSGLFSTDLMPQAQVLGRDPPGTTALALNPDLSVMSASVSPGGDPRAKPGSPGIRGMRETQAAAKLGAEIVDKVGDLVNKIVDLMLNALQTLTRGSPDMPLKQAAPPDWFRANAGTVRTDQQERG